MTTCQLCSLPRKMVSAHAVPEAFFRELRDGSGTPRLISGTPGIFPKKAPIGVYDEEILCELCEPKFGPADDYGIEVLLKCFADHFHVLSRDGISAGYESHSVDPGRLLQFLVSVLWRASVSKQPFYSKVALGPHEAAALLSVSAPATELPPVFDAVLSRWKDEDERVPRTAILDPRPEKWFGVNAYRLYLGETVAYVKVDRRPFPEKFRAISLRSAPPTLVVARLLSEAKEMLALKRTVTASHQFVQTFRAARRQR